MPPKAASLTNKGVRGGWLAAAAIFFFSLALAPAAETQTSSDGMIHRDISYVPASGAAGPRTLDLYLPAKPSHKPPLVAFAQGTGVPEDSPGVDAALARTLMAQGVAVALVRYRLSPFAVFPENVEDVALALAFLQRAAGEYGYDADRLFLAGHSSGAYLVSLAVLDEKFMRAAGARPPAGVVAVSGIYDLAGGGPPAKRKKEILDPVFGDGKQDLRAASPMAHVRRGPPFLVLSAENDYPGFQPDARRFAAALRAAGQSAVQEIIVPGADHSSIMNFSRARHPARELLLEFIGAGKASPVTSALAQARRVWQEPPHTAEAFWSHPELVESYPVDDRFRTALKKIYEHAAFELKSYPMQRFHAIDLGRFLERRADKVGRGDYLTLTNVRGEKTFWRLGEIEAYRPVIVIGLDDERNLFRLTVFYQNRLEYSWKPDTPYMMARSVGAFIHFLKPPPAELQPPTASMYALTTESFHLSEANPLAGMADLPRDIYEVMYHRNACFSCHSFRGTGVRAGHVRARNGEPAGGYALALEDYPAEALRRFLFEQEKSAALIGVRPNAVDGTVARRLHELVAVERNRRTAP